jgi:hypothetical protein
MTRAGQATALRRAGAPGPSRDPDLADCDRGRPGRGGAAFATEGSLAQPRDWLLGFGAFVGGLIFDEDGIYDPRLVRHQPGLADKVADETKRQSVPAVSGQPGNVVVINNYAWTEGTV